MSQFLLRDDVLIRFRTINALISIDQIQLGWRCRFPYVNLGLYAIDIVLTVNAVIEH